MSGVIKSAQLSGHAVLRPTAEQLPSASVIPIGRFDEERDLQLRRIARLEDEVRRYETAMAELGSRVDKAREEGVEQGYATGLAAAEDRQAERLTLLEQGLRAAVHILHNSSLSVARLAPLLARDCIDLIFGSDNDREDVIARIIQNQIAKLDKSMLCEIRLSRLDFPNDGDIAQLRARFDNAPLHLSAQEDLPAGACVMLLRLGQMSVGVDQQWPALRELLGDLSQPEFQG